MDKKFHREIFKQLSKAVTTGYRIGIKSIVTLNKKMNYATTNLKYSVSYTASDEEAIKNFLIEAFEVAGVGSYELEEKIKEAGEKLLRNEIKSQEDFEIEVRRLMMEYGIGLGEQPPGGWIKTNIDTAIVSSTNAARWNRLNEKGVSELYPALQYKTQEDIAVRDEHAILNNSVYKKEDPIWNIIYPPNGWNCRCYVKPIGITEVKNYDMMKSDEKYRKEISSKIDVNFRRNAGETNSIWGKWLEKKYPDMTEENYKELKREVDKYKKTI